MARGRWSPAVLVVVAAELACSGGGSGPAPPAPAGARPAGVLTIGALSLSPGREHEVVQPFADYLAARLGEVGIGHGRVVVVESVHGMVEELAAGRVDLYIDSPFPVAFAAEHGSGLKVLLRRWKHGAESYRSLIFARADSGIETLADLRGRMIAFGEPFSTTGYLLPKTALVAAGLQVAGYQDPAAAVPPDRVGYVFSNDAESTVFWVLKGKVSAGAGNEDYFAEMTGERIDELRIVARTPSLPRNLVGARRGLDPAVEAAIVDVLLAMEDDEKGRAVLAAYEETARFDRLPQGEEEALAEVAGLLQFVAEDLGG
ncbi:MAG: phosphate/phosphite/phosphonate ABC transporter substrate-binding protein [Thermoanaerobaculales bacterium]|nr:phosphate/phosphite/phosphonate ABC transporter substrate-binding protein [Thermoanaerobaculales bacterium]